MRWLGALSFEVLQLNEGGIAWQCLQHFPCDLSSPSTEPKTRTTSKFHFLKGPKGHTRKGHREKLPENTLKTPFSTFSLCPLWVCPLHLSKFSESKNTFLDRRLGTHLNGLFRVFNSPLHIGVPRGGGGKQPFKWVQGVQKGIVLTPKMEFPGFGLCRWRRGSQHFPLLASMKVRRPHVNQECSTTPLSH